MHISTVLIHIAFWDKECTKDKYLFLGILGYNQFESFFRRNFTSVTMGTTLAFYGGKIK